MPPTTPNWTDYVILSFVTLTNAGLFMMVWWKLSSANKQNRAELDSHGKRLLTVETEVQAHHLNTAIHRNPDFERRFFDLVESIKTLGENNSREHKEIMAQILERR